MEFLDRVQQVTATIGTGAYDITGAAAESMRRFVDAATDGREYPYCVVLAAEYEYGLGTISGNTLVRTTIYGSSNSNNAVDWAVGDKTLFCDVPAFILNDLEELNHANGFDRQAPDTMGTITYDDARTCTIDVKSGQTTFHFWAGKRKFVKTTASSITVPDVTGMYYVYFDTNGVLQYLLYGSITPEMFHEYAIVALIRWNATQQSGGCGAEQHGILKDGTSHMQEHFTVGALWESGMDIEGLVDGEPTYTQTTSGYFWDEDIRHPVDAKSTHPFMYRLGTEGEWTTLPADNSVGYNGGSGDYYWNEWTGVTFQLTRMDSSHDYGIYFFAGIPGLGNASEVKFIGQNAYSNRTNARNAMVSEMERMKLDGLPSPELRFTRAIIVRRNGDLEELDGGAVYFDLRKITGGGGGSSTETKHAGDIPIVDAGDIIAASNVEDALQENRTAIDLNTVKNTYPSADATKLSGIEDNATADQTSAEIKAAYEANSDTNAFTDGDESKLDGIEDNATADQDLSSIDAVSVVKTFTTASAFSIGNVGFVSSAGTAILADASAESTSNGLLLLAGATVADGASGSFAILGDITAASHGLTVGAPIYLGTTAGTITNTAPSTAGQIVRVIGYATSADTIYFRGDSTYLEV